MMKAPVPVVFGHVDEGGPPGHSDDVDHAVESAELAHGLIHHPFDLARLPSIGHARRAGF